MQEAKVTRPAEALGQDVLKHQPQEGGAAHGAGFELPRGAVLIAERHFTVLAGEDVVLANHAPIQISAQIDQRLLATADGLAVDDPLVRIARRQGKSGMRQSVQHLGPKLQDFAHWTHPISSDWTHLAWDTGGAAGDGFYASFLREASFLALTPR